MKRGRSLTAIFAAWGVCLVAFQNCSQDFVPRSVAVGSSQGADRGDNGMEPGGSSTLPDGSAPPGTTPGGNTSAPPPATGNGGDFVPDNGPSTGSAKRIVMVRNSAELLAAIGSALAGDAITLDDGTYRLNSNVIVSRAGTPTAKIFVTARNPGMARIEHCNVEGFKVTASDWVFENLEFRGVCRGGGAQNAHAFHVTGAGHRLIIRNSTIVDFQSHVKLNQESPGGVQTWPNDNWYINNVWKHTSPMTGTDPKNVLNVDGGLRHVIRGNVFADIATANSNQHQSAIYPKAGVKGAIIENNMVVCNKHVTSGNSIRAIFTGDQSGSGGICDGSCTNQNNVYRNNIVLKCQGAGNSGGFVISNEETSVYLHNTLHDVKWNQYGSNVPGPNSFESNLMYRAWLFGGTPRPTEANNLTPDASGMASIFVNPDAGNFALKDGALIRSKVQRSDKAPHDFCGNARSAQTDIGAIDYSHPKAAECVDFIRRLYERI